LARADQRSLSAKTCGLALALSALLAASPGYAGGLEEARQAARARDFTRTAEILKPLAEAGNLEAQVTLAGLYRAGQGVEKNHEAAVRLLTLAAKAGDAGAQYQLGVMHENGWGTPRDLAQAKKWFAEADKQGHPLAREKLRLMAKAPSPAPEPALLAAARAGNLAALESALLQSETLEYKDDTGRTAFFLAAVNRHFDAALKLAEAGADRDAQDRDGDTALIQLTREGDEVGVKQLLSMGADPGIENREKESALGLAGNNAKLAPLFAEAKALEDARQAARARDFSRTAEILKPLAEAGNLEAQVTLAGLYRAGQGVEKNHEAAVRLLTLAAKAGDAGAKYQLGIMHENGWGTPKDPAQAKKWFAEARGHALAEVKKTQLAQAENESLETLAARLLAAAGGGRAEEARFLIERGAPVNAADPHGLTPLIAATLHGHLEVIGVLLESGADVEKENRYGDRALHIASARGDRDAVARLVNARASKNSRDKNGNTPLLVATLKRRDRVALFLIENGADIAPKNKKDLSAADVAKANKSQKVLQALIAKGATLRPDGPKEPDTAALIAQLEESASGAQGAGGDHPYANWPPLTIAAYRGQTAVARALLAGGAAVDAQDPNSKSALHRAAERGFTEIVRALLDHGANANLALPEQETPLHLAARGGHTEVMKLLLKAGADKSAATKSGITALGLAIENNRKEAANLLVAPGGRLAREDKDAALILAAGRGWHGLALSLLKQGANVNSRDPGGQGALSHAASAGHLETVELLLEQGADALARDKAGHSPLALAAKRGHARIVDRLIRAKASVDQPAAGGNTALMLAAAHGHLETVRLLLDAGSSVNGRNDNGDTALFMAVREGHAPVVAHLLEQGADPNLRNGKRQQAYSQVAEGRDDIMTLLKNHKASRSWFSEIF